MSQSRPTLSQPLQVTRAAASLRRTPQSDGPQETEMLFGETFYLYEEENGWGWGQTGLDSYVGFVDISALSGPVGEPTHRVAALRTYRYSKPDLKSKPRDLLSMNAKLRIEDAPSGKFVREVRGGWVYADHLAPVEARADDYVSIAEKFLGTPYFWGGRTSLGLDCSALVQNTLEPAGLTVPRDSSQQQEFFRTQQAPVLFAQTPGISNWRDLTLTRGDLVFWKGHVVIMMDAIQMLHANATHMAVTVDNLEEFAAKHLAREGDVQMIVRPKL